MIRPLLILVLAGQLAAVAPKPPESLKPPDPDRVEVVLFSDFQCPFCAQFAKPFRELQTQAIDGVKTTVEFRNFPLAMHPNSQLAHQAAMAARDQGKFWEMHDLLFTNQQRVQREDLLNYAKQLGLDTARFERDMDSDRVKQMIAADLAEGEKRGIQGTPTFYVNGREYSGTRSFDQLKQVVRTEQSRTRALAEITDDMMSKGPASAPVTIELFVDLESPVSRPAINVVNEVMRTHPSAIRLQFRNFPLAFHPQAALAHEAAMTAAREGHFWDFAAYLLDHQDSVREQDLIAYAGRLGLDETSFAKKLDEHRYAPRVEADIQNGQQRGIRGSPVVIVNGKRIDGVASLKTLTEYVDAALAAKPTAKIRTP